jgi:plasmid replication initiation protein
VLSFESRYSLRLYLFVSLRANLRKVSEDMSLDDLRDMLGVPINALPRWQDVKRRALDPAVAEINHVAGFNAAYEPIKRGRRIVGVRLAWGLKDRAELVKAQRELDRPRVGRTARRDGVVETIAQERHRLAESLASAGLSRTSEPDE